MLIFYRYLNWNSICFYHLAFDLIPTFNWYDPMLVCWIQSFSQTNQSNHPTINKSTKYQRWSHTFLAWNSYPHMKISWFQLIMADFDDRSWQKIAIFCHLFQSQAMRCKIRTRWAMMTIFYSSDTPRVIFLPWDHLKKGGRKGVRSLSFGWLSSIKNWWKTKINEILRNLLHKSLLYISG